MVINMNKAYLAIILLLSASNAALAQDNDFDKICKIYSTVLKHKMNAQAGSDYINKHIKLQVHNKVALRAQNDIFLVPQAKRYRYFRMVAENALKAKWHCAAMQTLLNHPPK